MAIDLNGLRNLVHESQKSSQTNPADPARQIVVDREGRVRMGHQVGSGEQVTQVQQDTFAACGA